MAAYNSQTYGNYKQTYLHLECFNRNIFSGVIMTKYFQNLHQRPAVKHTDFSENENPILKKKIRMTEFETRFQHFFYLRQGFEPGFQHIFFSSGSKPPTVLFLFQDVDSSNPPLNKFLIV